MTDINITLENVLSFEIGTKVVLNFGAYHPIEKGMVVDYHVIPASKHFPGVYELVIEKEDGEVHHTRRLVTKGIGVYLEEVYMNG